VDKDIKLIRKFQEKAKKNSIEVEDMEIVNHRYSKSRMPSVGTLL
jgi:hypothetical protein